MFQFVREERGATAIEYGVIASMVSVVLIAVLYQVGYKTHGTFHDVATGLHNAAMWSP